MMPATEDVFYMLKTTREAHMLSCAYTLAFTILFNDSLLSHSYILSSPRGGYNEPGRVADTMNHETFPHLVVAMAMGHSC
jgi:hypothetical protein